MFSQCKYFIYDIKRGLGTNKWRIIMLPFSRNYIGIGWYRFERSMYLLIPKYYPILRIPLLPISFLINIISNFEIHYKANIGPGLKVLHPSMGVVINGSTVIGKNLTLTGGNVIGLTQYNSNKSFEIGNNCTLGANAVILGPIQLGNNIKIGASACVVKNHIEDNLVLVGVPAQVKIKQTANS